MLRATTIPLGNVAGSSTFAALPTGQADGTLWRVSNYGRGGSNWRYQASDTTWYPVAPTKVYESTALISGALTVSDQLLLAIPCEAGLLANKVWRLLVSIGRDGVTDAFGATTTLRMGTAGTVADTAVESFGLSSLLTGGTARSLGLEFWHHMASATSVERLGGTPQGTWLSNSVTSGTLNGATTVSSVASQLTYVSITTTMAGTTNKPQLGYVALEIQP